jgi:hypothetical protein
MAKLKFSDGEEFDLSGSFRKERRTDGWYVLGENMMIPVMDEQEADEYIDKYTKPASCKDSRKRLEIVRSEKGEIEI